MTSFTRQYSFPNVSVRETIRGPQQFTSVWRNTIGIAAPFSKGPLVAAITSRQDLVNLYGEDNSIGSIAVRQAMLQGATNFVISRALPKAKGAYGSISLANPNGATNQEPVIGATNSRTVGLKVDFSFISNVITLDNSLVAYTINPEGTSNAVPVINNSAPLALDFDGIGAFNLVKVTTLWESAYDFFLRTTEPTTTTTEDLVLTGFDEIASSNLAPTTGEKIIKVTFPKSAVLKDRYVRAFAPGMRITGGTNGPVFAQPGTIVSELVNEDDLHYSFYVQANITAAGTNSSFKLMIPSGTETLPTVDVYRLFFRPNSNELLPGNVMYFGGGVNAQPNPNLPVGYLVFNRHDSVAQELPLSFYTKVNLNETELTRVNSGITYKLGLATDTYAHVITNTQTINFAKTSIAIGETDTNAAGFPNTNLAFDPNKPISDVLSELRVALNDSVVLGALNAEVFVNTNAYPYSATISLGIQGEIGNKLIYSVEKISQGNASSDIEFNDGNTPLFSTNLNFVGGLNDVIPATKFFYNRLGEKVLYIEALSPGFSGNNIKVNVKPIDQSNFILEVKELVPTGQQALPAESFYLSNSTVDLATGIYPETLSSKLIRAYYIPVIDAIGSGSTEVDFNQSPVRVAPPDLQGALADVNYPTHPAHVGSQFTQNIALQGGSEPAQYDSFIPEEAYIDAIDRLNEQDVAILIAPGLVAGDVRYERAVNSLIQQANQATPYNGLRLAVLSAPPKLTPSRAELLNSQYSSPNLVIIGGWSTLATTRGIGINQYSPEGFYAGLLAVSDTYISPASSYNNNFIVGARNVDTDGRLSSLDVFTNNNIEMLYVDRVSGKVKFLNGRTTAGDLNNRWVAIRRQSQHLIMNIVANLQWARSAPNDPETRQKVASAVDALLKTEQRRGAIAGFTPTSINASDANRAAQGYMDIVITWTPVFPADYISVELIRTISNQFSLQLG